MKKLIALMILNCFLIIPFIAAAQDDPGGDPGAVPLDGGTSILLAAGVGYGVKKYRQYQKNKRAYNHRL